MCSKHVSEQNTSLFESEPPSAVTLLKQGISCIQQGHYSEGIAFFSLAREHLSPAQMQTVVILDDFIQDYMNYLQVQQELHQASKHLVEIYTRQKTRMTSLENLISTLTQDTEPPASIEWDTKDPLLSLEETPTDQAEALLIEKLPDHINSHKNGTFEPPTENAALPSLYFTCFGHFTVTRCEQTISLCSNRNGQAILRYLIAQANHRVTMDTLMALLWPDDEPETAHHKLQVAISALRRSLNNGYVHSQGGGYILCKNGIYQLNPQTQFRTDVEEFVTLYQLGRSKGERTAILEYEAACRRYTGPFLVEDLYVDWPLIQREQLSQMYFIMCRALSEHYFTSGHYGVAAKWSSAILTENHCDETAHRQLMRIYTAEGRRSEALRQYQRCERILADELGVALMPETVKLFHAILHNEISRFSLSELPPQE